MTRSLWQQFADDFEAKWKESEEDVAVLQGEVDDLQHQVATLQQRLDQQAAEAHADRDAVALVDLGRLTDDEVLRRRELTRGYENRPATLYLANLAFNTQPRDIAVWAHTTAGLTIRGEDGTRIGTAGIAWIRVASAAHAELAVRQWAQRRDDGRPDVIAGRRITVQRARHG